MHDPRHTALGRRALGLFGRRIRFMPRYPPLVAVHLPLLREISLMLLALWFWTRAGAAVRRDSGRSLPAQLVDLLWLGLRERIDPISYYLYGLYLPQRRADAAEYLTRYHTKNGVLQALNHLRRAPYPQRTELTDKLRFAGWCERLGVRSPPVLMATDPDVASEAFETTSLDTDLFVKLRYGKGARNTRLYRRVAPLRYRAPDGTTLSLEQVRETLRVPGRKRALIVQQRLLNHPALADLAGESLLVVRVMTCLDAHGQPRITDAMLRVLAKLEPGWQRRKDDEWVAAVDVGTGELGRLTGDMPETCTVWHDTHPVTGAAVRGRMLPHWPAVCALALAAHRGFCDRVVVGWDIAITPDGPQIVEGNPNPDVLLIQRVHGAPIGRRPLGALLHGYFDRLDVAVPAGYEPRPMPPRRLQAAAVAGLLMAVAVHLHMPATVGSGGTSAGHLGGANAAWVEPTAADVALQGEVDTDQIVDAVVSSLQAPLPGSTPGHESMLPDAILLAQAVAAAERYTGATAVHAEALQDDPTHYKVELVNAGGLLVAVVDRNGSGMANMLY